MKKFIALCLGLLLCLSLCACGASEEEEIENDFKEFSFENLDLAAIADEIYEAAELSELTAKSVSVISDKTTLTEQFYLDLSKVTAYEIRSAEGNFGAADVALLIVNEGETAEVAESLEKRKDDRINEFLDYDVYNSYNVALEAEIYEEGRLVVMLMLSEDANAAAKAIIDSHLE